MKVGLVGVGGYGQRHASTLCALQAGGACELLAVADPFASRYETSIASLRAQGAEVFFELDALLARRDIEAVVIATPIALHAPQALAALNGDKCVYLEKPPCVALDELAQLTAAQARSGKTCAVGFQMQSTPAIQFLKSQLVQGALGPLETVWASIRWKRGDAYYNRSPWVGKWTHEGAPVFDGPATNALSHVVHAALFLAGETTEAWAQVLRVRGALKKARPIESYDAAFLEAQTRSGVRVRLAFSHATRQSDPAMIRCRGARGEATLDWNGTVLLAPRGEEPQRFSFACETHVAAMLDFLRAARDASHAPATTLENCRPYLQATGGALQSSRGIAHFEGRAIERIENEDGDGSYVVAGLDDEFEIFGHDPDAVPSLLSPGDWIEAAALQTRLELPA